ncbi:MAG: glycosyltransferase family 2 protein [Microgenomates group bacterium]|nr:glycosyltransferase family 2 protein [Microgenomates group bacterium]
MKLSLCIPAYNEEKNIHYPLDSAYDLADEVIIIDAGSTDKTSEIAQSYGCKIKIFRTDNPRNFLINKQRAIEKAKGEWILQLDADEALSEELKKEIIELINSQSGKEKTNNHTSQQFKDKEVVAYWIPRKNFFLNRFLMKGGVYPDYVLRLYKKENVFFDLKDLHENVKIKPDKKNQNPKTGYLKNPILHFADPDFSRYLLRWDRYTTFDAQELFQKYQGKSKGKNFLLFCQYFFIKPIVWFIKVYFRHKGLIDGFPGFVFALFSSIRFWVIYIKWWQIKNHQKSKL